MLGRRIEGLSAEQQVTEAHLHQAIDAFQAEANRICVTAGAQVTNQSVVVTCLARASTRAWLARAH